MAAANASAARARECVSEVTASKSSDCLYEVTAPAVTSRRGPCDQETQNESLIIRDVPLSTLCGNAFLFLLSNMSTSLRRSAEEALLKKPCRIEVNEETQRWPLFQNVRDYFQHLLLEELLQIIYTPENISAITPATNLKRLVRWPRSLTRRIQPIC